MGKEDEGEGGRMEKSLKRAFRKNFKRIEWSVDNIMGGGGGGEWSEIGEDSEKGF